MSSLPDAPAPPAASSRGAAWGGGAQWQVVPMDALPAPLLDRDPESLEMPQMRLAGGAIKVGKGPTESGGLPPLLPQDPCKGG